MRHAISTFNEHGDPSKDCPLSLNGFEQASKVEGDYDLVIVSPLKRTKQTLLASKLQYPKVISSVLCRERRDSNCDFLENETIDKESEEDFAKRIQAFLCELKEYKRLYQNILVITHHGVIKQITGKYVSNCEKTSVYFTV